MPIHYHLCLFNNSEGSFQQKAGPTYICGCLHDLEYRQRHLTFSWWLLILASVLNFTQEGKKRLYIILFFVILWDIYRPSVILVNTLYMVGSVSLENEWLSFVNIRLGQLLCWMSIIQCTANVVRILKIVLKISLKKKRNSLIWWADSNKQHSTVCIRCISVTGIMCRGIHSSTYLIFLLIEMACLMKKLTDHKQTPQCWALLKH